MPYIIRDSATAAIAKCEQLDDAIQVVNAALTSAERDGRIVDREREGRWAIYDGYMIKMLWIETDNGSVISFAR